MEQEVKSIVPKIPHSQIGLNEVLSIQQNSIMGAINCHNIGKIVRFYPETQTADIQIMILKQIEGETIVPSLLSKVPLIIYGTGMGNITFPNPEGTNCLLLFIDRNIDNFLMTGEMYAPRTPRMHDFADCIALTSFRTLVDSMPEYDERAVSILNEEKIEGVKSNSYIKVYGNSVHFKVNIEGEEEEEATGSSMTLDDKVSISNTKQSLAALIQAFVTACESITTITGDSIGSLTSESKQTFANLKEQFEALLK